jgi:hypothetical protein
MRLPGNCSWDGLLVAVPGWVMLLREWSVRLSFVHEDISEETAI